MNNVLLILYHKTQVFTNNILHAVYILFNSTFIDYCRYSSTNHFQCFTFYCKDYYEHFIYI